MTSLLVPRRFNGPPSSGNGGWTGGALAGLAGLRSATVQLRQPPPLDFAMPVTGPGGGPGDDGWTVAAGPDGATVLRVRIAEVDPTPVGAVPLEVARAAEASYAGHTSHPFPGCYVCGTERPDGMRIFPGRVADEPGSDPARAVRMAAAWTPALDGADDPDPLASTWAALDCIGGWAGDLAERLMVLGTMTAAVTELPEPGVAHVLVGGSRGVEGRKTFTAATLYTADGRLLAAAEHVWIAVDPKDFA